MNLVSDEIELPPENEFGIGLFSVCIFKENKENVGLGRIMMSGGLDYSRMRNQNLDAPIKLENKDETIPVFRKI